ncbi:glycerate kinase [[Clostridium] symbiosum]|uniref:glycerate kinase n=1 Tax=Clostridium symbiosum TaxID=1512 RepID=UPI001D0647D8|nr:glycerate kinase [[Clostridium] symbiosum]MCB6610852.1 glycerate kinase [[Clostridium] symbiosum]MCB6933329.1 glycerate kinase [[Clostridium] symbiosum]
MKFLLAPENICPLIRGARITVMCDVKNPLTGKDGAALAVFLDEKMKPGIETVLLRECSAF